MIEPQTEFAIWVALEFGGFVIAMFAAHRLMREALAAGQRLRRAGAVVILYGIVVSSVYATWFYLGHTLTLYGSFLFGCIVGGLHLVLITTLIPIAWRFVPRLR
jgi:hypothetical protein